MNKQKTKKRILHVDDQIDTLKVVKIILEKEGYEVVSVRNGMKALHEVDLDGFDLILLDIMMSDMSGWELFTRIGKVNPKYKIIFLSILDISSTKLKQLLKAGVKDYIKKPFDIDDFVARIKKIIK